MSKGPVTQEWVNELSFMQQSVLISAIRGCDGLAKFHPAKILVRWYRRCVLLSAFDGRALTDPFEPGGGSFTGPIPTDVGHFTPHGDSSYGAKRLNEVVNDFLNARDELPAHYQEHFMHAAEIIGFKHPVPWIRKFWYEVYYRMARAKHLWPELEEQLDERLGDTPEGWQKHADDASSCSD